MVQVEVPPDGLVQVKAGPVTCVSDWNVEFVATLTVSVTSCASLGPLFVTNTLKGALEPADTWKGAEIEAQRSTAALLGSRTTNVADAYPSFEASTVFTVQVPTRAKGPVAGITIELV